jgi:predicted glycosyltransferase involved in capsule biosynthesis
MRPLSLSIIIPIKITFQNRFLFSRVKQIMSYFSNFNEIEVVLVDSSPKVKYAKALASIGRLSKQVNYYFLAMENIYSASKARNYGSKMAKGAYLLFYDVDLVVKDDFLFNILKDIEALTPTAFTLYPCLYLSEVKTKRIEGKKINNQTFEDIKEHYMKGFNDEVLYLAVNTSTILVSRKHFFSIGGYNEVYKGHGYEDFELIHRLYMSYPIVPKGDDYVMDFKTPFPLLYKGFRKYFAYYALPNFFKGNYTLHLWHPRPLTKKYYRHREINLGYFIGHLKESFSQKLDDKYFDRTIINYNNFIENLLLNYGFSDKKYCGLEDLNPLAKAKKPKFNLKRKIRRRFLNLLDKF